MERLKQTGEKTVRKQKKAEADKQIENRESLKQTDKHRTENV